MKRIVASTNKYQSDADKYLKLLGMAGASLADCVNCQTDDALNDVADDAGFRRKFKEGEPFEERKAYLIKRMVANINQIAEYYEQYATTSSAYPRVTDELVSLCKTLGCPMTPTACDWSKDSYVLVPADTAEFEDLNKICKQIQDHFGFAKWDTPLSGSWTGHSAQIDGVRFHVAIERDYAYDPSGKERSIQLYFN